MRVLCIDATDPKTPALLKPEHMIYEGEVYTVCGSYFDPTDNFHYYFLAERTALPRASYRENRFVPIKDGENDKRTVTVEGELNFEWVI